jgi:hypothetical protein
MIRSDGPTFSSGSRKTSLQLVMRGDVVVESDGDCCDSFDAGRGNPTVQFLVDQVECSRK